MVVARGRDVLLVKRGIEPYRGHWGLPAGFQEYWESPEEAAVREIHARYLRAGADCVETNTFGGMKHVLE